MLPKICLLKTKREMHLFLFSGLLFRGFLLWCLFCWLIIVFKWVDPANRHAVLGVVIVGVPGQIHDITLLHHELNAVILDVIGNLGSIDLQSLSIDVMGNDQLAILVFDYGLAEYLNRIIVQIQMASDPFEIMTGRARYQP